MALHAMFNDRNIYVKGYVVTSALEWLLLLIDLILMYCKVVTISEIVRFYHLEVLVFVYEYSKTMMLMYHLYDD